MHIGFGKLPAYSIVLSFILKSLFFTNDAAWFCLERQLMSEMQKFNEVFTSACRKDKNLWTYYSHRMSSYKKVVECLTRVLLLARSAKTMVTLTVNKNLSQGEALGKKLRLYSSQSKNLSHRKGNGAMATVTLTATKKVSLQTTRETWVPTHRN